MGRPIKWTEERIAKAYADGHGEGTGASYKPWLKVQSFSSEGVSSRPYSVKTQRHHELLSNVELSLFLALEWQHDVVDIREQYPLDRDISLTIARELGIRHPTYPDTKVPTVMTVDFLVTRQTGGQEILEAYNAKTASEIENPNVLWKLEIQRSYFAGMGIAHHIVLDTEIPKIPIENLRWINDANVRKGEKQPYTNYWNEWTDRFEDFLRHEVSSSKTLEAICTQFDNQLGSRGGTGIRAARILMAQHVLIPELSSPNLLTAPIRSFHLAGTSGKLRAVGSSK